MRRDKNYKLRKKEREDRNGTESSSIDNERKRKEIRS